MEQAHLHIDIQCNITLSVSAVAAPDGHEVVKQAILDVIEQATVTQDPLTRIVSVIFKGATLD